MSVLPKLKNNVKLKLGFLSIWKI